MSRGPAQLVHLARRAMWNLVPRSVAPIDVAFVRARLSPPAADLFFTLDARDQVHSIAVARRVQRTPGIPAEVVEAALLHDIGKAHARLGVVGRAVATLIEWTPLTERIAGRVVEINERAAREDRSDAVAQSGALLARIGAYLRYEELGALDLIRLGYAPESLAVRWSREHHWPDDRWSIPIEFGWVLSAADH